MHKLTLDRDGQEVAQSPAAVFVRGATASGSARIIAHVPDGQADLLQRLSLLLPPPFYVLYVLHTPRGEGEPGRYQSPELSRDELANFLERYRPFFAADGRHDLWVYSPRSGQTLVWDRHNALFVEGERLDEFVEALVERGFSEGELEPIGGHFHNYRPEWDAEATALLGYFDWLRTPLRPEDEQ